MRQLIVMTAAVTLAFCSSSQASVSLTRWQDQARATSGNVVANPSTWIFDGSGGVNINYGNLDADGAPWTQDLGASVEFIFNLEDNDRSICLGSLYGWNNAGLNEYKLEQFSESGKFGITAVDLVDARFDGASSIFNTDTHVIYVNRTDGNYELFVNGISRGTDTRVGEWVTNGGVGKLGSRPNGNDAAKGTIYALGTYNRALNGPEIGDLYMAWKGYEPQLTAKLSPIDGHYYQLGESTTWDQARANAVATSLAGVPGHLVTISNEEENRLVQLLSDDCWIGLTDATAVSSIDGWNPAAELGTAEGGATWSSPYPPAGEVPDEPTERGYGFRWIDGTPLVYQGWVSGEPNDAGSAEDAAVSRPWGWNDHKAGSTLGQGDHRIPSVIEFDTVLGGHKFDVLERRSTIAMDHLAAARSLLDLPPGAPQIAAEETARLFALSLADPEAGDVSEDTIAVPFLTDTPGDDDYFALRATTQLEIPTAGQWTFAIVHNDYAELAIGGWHYSTAPSASGTHLHTMHLDAGPNPLELVFLERTGNAHLQLFAAEGTHDTFDPFIFRLVGDELGGGLHLVPEPSTFILLAVAAVGLLAYTRRRRK
ncbi:MAG: PEP-CTERM sorting domain-containing protein [Candidatus Nealsonbacteria bacterium]|nr:PEP-CTERM sorting domain-containing protein [Candidatus Nealsonbacteria bacterium]